MRNGGSDHYVDNRLCRQLKGVECARTVAASVRALKVSWQLLAGEDEREQKGPLRCPKGLVLSEDGWQKTTARFRMSRSRQWKWVK